MLLIIIIIIIIIILNFVMSIRRELQENNIQHLPKNVFSDLGSLWIGCKYIDQCFKY